MVKKTNDAAQQFNATLATSVRRNLAFSPKQPSLKKTEKPKTKSSTPMEFVQVSFSHEGTLHENILDRNKSIMERKLTFESYTPSSSGNERASITHARASRRRLLAIKSTAKTTEFKQVIDAEVQQQEQKAVKSPEIDTILSSWLARCIDQVVVCSPKVTISDSFFSGNYSNNIKPSQELIGSLPKLRRR